jgi:hypothetical protein
MADGLIQRAVPRRVLDEIKALVRRESQDGEKGWRAASKSEDTITGHLGSALARDWSEPIVAEGYSWRYRVDYRKFSGSTEEPATGADGVFQIEIDRFDVGVTPLDESVVKPEIIEIAERFKKGILFQSKKIDNSKREELVEQLENMEKLSPNEGAYFEYGPDAFRATAASAVVAVDGFTKRIEASAFPRLGDFLADEFLECKRGVEGMYYDFDRDTLFFPNSSGGIEAVRLAIKHGFRILVNAFRLVPFRTANE